MPDKPSKSRRRTIWRWLLRCGVVVVVLFAVIVVVLQIVFMTSLPRNLVIGIVQRTLGLRVTATSLSTGFFGHTTLHNVTLSLPLAEDAFFKVDELDIRHTSIPALLFKRSVDVRSVKLVRPNVVVQQDAAGNWNLEEVAILLGRASGSNNPQQSGSSGPTALPKLDIVDGNVAVLPNNGQRGDLAPLNVHGEPETPLTWKYDVSIGKQLSAVGRVAPSGDFRHEVAIKLHDVDEWVALFSPGFKHAIEADGVWRGSLAANGLVGRLELNDARFDSFTAKGPVSVRTGDTTEIRPEALVLQTGVPAAPDVVVNGGAVRLEPSAVVADRISVSVAGGTASLTARYEQIARQLDASLHWRDVNPLDVAISSGDASLSVNEPISGQPRIIGKLNATGRAGDATWDSAIRLEGSGRSYGDIDWNITADRLLVDMGSRHANLANTVAQLNTNGDHITVKSLTRPGAALDAFGEYDIGDNQWYVWANGRGPRLSDSSTEPLYFSINAWGAGKLNRLTQLYLRDSGLELTANGYYITGRPEPVFLNLSLTQPNHPAPIAGVAAARPASSLVGGRLAGDFYIHGKMKPSNLYLQGWLVGRDVVVADQSLGDLKVALEGTVDKHRTLQLWTNELSLFEGKWSIKATSPTPWNSTHIVATVDKLPLAEVGKVLDVDDISGTFNGRWNIDMPSFDLNEAQLTGTFDATDLKAGGLVAQSLKGQTKLHNGRFVDDMTFAQDNAVANVSIATTLDRLSRLSLTADVDRWPLALAGARAHTRSDIDADLIVDLKNKGVAGTASVSTDATLDDKPLGNAKINLSAAGRVVRIDQMNSNLFGGTAEGSARVDFDNLSQSVARMSWTDIDAEPLVAVVPKLEGLEGKFSGLLVAAPDTRPRPLAPLGVVINMTPTNGKYRTLAIGPMLANVAIDHSESWRVVLDQAKMEVAGGTVSVWARAARHTFDDPILKANGRDNVISTQASIRLQRLDLNEIVHAFKPTEKPIHAKIGGEINLLSEIGKTETLVGSGRIRIRDGYLANFKPIEVLYNALHVGQNDKRNGSGELAVSIDSGRLDINKIEYYESGIDMRGVATAYDLTKGGESKVSGALAGTLQPFRNIKLPFLADADDILAAVQQFVTPIKISGTLGKIEATPVAFADVADALRKVVSSDSSSQNGGDK